MFRSLMHGPFFVESRPYQEERLTRLKRDRTRYSATKYYIRQITWQETQRTLNMFPGGLIPSEVNMQAGKQILDIACDDGQWAYEMALRYPQ